MTEAFLHYVWQHQMLATGLTTTDGQPLCVLRAGEHNHDAGPDFLNARLRIGQTEWVGNVEIHIQSSDWMAHGHQRDAAYNNVILHVVYDDNASVSMQDGKSPTTLELKQFLHPSLIKNYDLLTAPDATGFVPCAARVGEVSSFSIGLMMERLVVERIEEKSQIVHQLLEQSHGGWEQTCYWLMARYFGGTVNALPFELLAKSTDQRLLARWRDNRMRLEALMLGQAGMLDGYFDDEYPRILQVDYEAIRHAADLKPIDGHMWRFFRIRPSSFPTIRISQFVDLAMQSKSLFSTLLQINDVCEMEKIFNRTASEYWDSHYRFDQVAATTCKKHLGSSQSQMLIINAWIPLLFTYGTAIGKQEYKDQALALLEQMKPENNAIVRQWSAIGVRASNAAQSQALLQLHKHYCLNRRCLECRVGYQLLKH